MATTTRDFADHCIELLAAAGPCAARRMFGGWGIATDGLTLALIADLGEGERLYLKADDETRARFEAAGCRQFIYTAKGKPVALHYYTAPEEAMDAAHAMAPWARLALESALKARKPLLDRSSRAPKPKAESTARGAHGTPPRKKPARG